MADDQMRALRALGISTVIQRRLKDAVTAVITDSDLTPIIARAPAITSHAIAELFLSHAAAVLLGDPTQLRPFLDRLDTMRRQLVAVAETVEADES